MIHVHILQLESENLIATIYLSRKQMQMWCYYLYTVNNVELLRECIVYIYSEYHVKSLINLH